MINSRDIKELDPASAALCQKWMDECVKQGIKVFLTSTFRDKASQDDLYAQGRTKPGKIATNAKGGQSFHQYRCAWDFCIYAADGKSADWNCTDKYKKAGDIGEKLGLFWGGNWTSLGDNCHLQNCKFSSLTASGLPKKYPAGERPKDW